MDSLRTPALTWSHEDEDELLETIEEAAERLTALVTNLLDMSRHPHRHGHRRADRGRRSRSPCATPRASWPRAGRIEVDLDDDALVTADPGLLDRVLANICENALKYTPAEAPIRIDAAPANGDRVTLRIADTRPRRRRPGHDRIFAPFQRLGDVPAEDGVGLGLAVARGLTEAMGGTVTTERPRVAA